MSLPAFATLDQLAARVAVDDEDRAQAALDDASVEIRSIAGVSFTTDGDLNFDGYPSWAEDALVKVCCSAAARALANPDGLTQAAETIGSYSHTNAYANASPDVYLTANEKRLVRRAAGRTGLGTITTTRAERTGAGALVDECGTEYLEVSPPGEPMPWLQGPVGY
jgi:phage gp36-like protein